MATNEEMPEDVLMLILSRLPVKSLLRFRSVSKYWNSLIQNPSFISLHNNRSRKNDSLLVKRYLKKDSLHILSLVSTETPSNDLFLPFVGTRARDLELFGSSNGVVCLGDISSANFMLCNPAMREFRILPLPPYRTRHVTSNLGFGLDLETNDYKVLRVAPLYKHDPRISAEIRVEERVQIYSMSTDSWREIVSLVPKDVLLYPEHSFATLLNGVFYWMCVDRKILAFHLSGEVFEQAFLPEDIGIHLFSDLCVLRDSLALAITSKLDSLTTEWSLGIWVRDGNRVKDPWNKKYSFGPIAPYRITLRFRLINGELLLFRGNDCRIVSYNLDTHSIKEYHEVYDYPRSIDFQVLPCTENLVSIKKRVY